MQNMFSDSSTVYRKGCVNRFKFCPFQCLKKRFSLTKRIKFMREGHNKSLMINKLAFFGNRNFTSLAVEHRNYQ